VCITTALFRGLADAGQTIILATHASELAEACDRTIRLSDGRIADVR
jgi:predicted ABC-type transport system involved in lysophospholipase L1 biosynthesis ATPase subunit